MQAQNAMSLINIAASPLLQPLTDVPELYRRVVTSMQLDPNEVVKTDAEIAQEMQMQQQMMQQQQQQPPVDPLGQAHLELKQQEIQIDAQLEQQKLQQEREIAMAKLTVQENTNMRQVQAKLQGDAAKGSQDDKKIGVDMMRENNRRMEMGLKRKMGSGI
jgi:hypothetical protein